LTSYPVLDVIVDDEIQLLFCEAVVPGKDVVNFIYDGLGVLGIELIISYLT